MLVIAVESVRPKLRGRLSVYLLEVRAGVFVGRATKKTREMLWEQVKALSEEGNSLMAWSTNSESGYDFLTTGANRRRPADFDGVPLVRFAPDAASICDEAEGQDRK